MNEMQVFNNQEFGKIRTLEENGQVLFCGADVAKALGYARPRDAIAAHAKGAVKRRTLTNGGEQEITFIPEGDVYRLIARSKLPAAERFERWVFDEVLPTIRKQGTYGQPEAVLPLDQVSQIIQRTATAVVSEVVRQLFSTIFQTPQPEETALSDDEPDAECVTTTITTEKKRRRREVPGKIEQLPAPLRQQVDNMLDSGVTYLVISEHLSKHGYCVSQMAICRYYNKYHS